MASSLTRWFDAEGKPLDDPRKPRRAGDSFVSQYGTGSVTTSATKQRPLSAALAPIEEGAPGTKARSRSMTLDSVDAGITGNLANWQGDNGAASAFAGPAISPTSAAPSDLRESVALLGNAVKARTERLQVVLGSIGGGGGEELEGRPLSGTDRYYDRKQRQLAARATKMGRISDPEAFRTQRGAPLVSGKSSASPVTFNGSSWTPGGNDASALSGNNGLPIGEVGSGRPVTFKGRGGAPDWVTKSLQGDDYDAY